MLCDNHNFSRVLFTLGMNIKPSTILKEKEKSEEGKENQVNT
jgi:hypothetical protein